MKTLQIQATPTITTVNRTSHTTTNNDLNFMDFQTIEI